ncbi:MAG: hypothetical protein KBD27_03525 [Candidatus Moranbacteria bacterium]|nr:hypothetical protein [Candidatus Moranbacteria bacterium]
MSQFTEKALAEITRKNIRPIPFWVTWLRNSAYWVGVIFLVLLSALAAAASFHAVSEIDWDAYVKADFSWFQMLLSGVPLFSFVLIILFFWVALYFLHQTRHGYRYPMVFLVGIFFSTSVVFGYFIEVSPLDEPTENFLLYALPHKNTLPTNLLPSAARQWSQPENGLLGGTVLSSNDTDFQLLDAREKLWTIEYTPDTLASDALLEPYEDIKVIGNQEDDDTFRATEIRDWKKSDTEKRKEETSVTEAKKKVEKEEKEKQDAKDEEEDADQEDGEDDVDQEDKEDSEDDEDNEDDSDEDEDDTDSHDED